jgi:sugar phosphate isomerase/epimerase
VVDKVVLSASPANIQQCVELALEHDLGIEVMAFAFPEALDGEWRTLVDQYRPLLRTVPGAITLHGPFMDMAPGSPDKQIIDATLTRFKQALQIAHELETEIVVFHANFLAQVHTEDYRIGWTRRNIDFWGPLASYASLLGVTIAIENMWEFDPYLIGDVLKAVEHPRLRACLDVGHAHLYSRVPFETWVRVTAPYLAHVHLNNNDGEDDVHRALADGVMDYTRILPLLRALPNQPTFVLEMDRVADMRASLSFLNLSVSQQAE